MGLYLCKPYTLEPNKYFDNAFNVWPHSRCALPMFDLLANQPEFVQPTRTPYDPYS